MATPKRKVGHPPKYDSAKKIQEKMDDYFDFCDNRTRDVYNEKVGTLTVSDPEPYTMSGLAYYLDMDRTTLVGYSHKEEFFNTIKRGRERVEHDIERRMNDKNTFTPGLIFNAKNNFGWKDKTETDLTSGGDKIEFPKVYLPKEEE
jgi:hypothetical protein